MKSLLNGLLMVVLFIGFVSTTQAMSAETNFVSESNAVSESNHFWENNFGTGVTKKSYKRMRIGMTFRACNEIIGFVGTQMSRNVGGGKVFTSVKWEGSDYAIITAVFRDNILTNKYEANLR